MSLAFNLRDSGAFKKLLFCFTLSFIFLYTFSLPSFGESKTATIYVVYFSMAALAASSFLYCYLYKDLKIHKLHLVIPLFVIFSFFGTVIFSHQFRHVLTLVLLTISFFAFYYSFKAVNNKYLIISVIALAFFCFSLYYIFHYRDRILDYKSYTNRDFRLGFDFDNPNAVGTYAAIGISMPLYLLLFWKNRVRYMFSLPILTSTIVGLTTGSRAFLVIALLMVLIFLYFKFKRHKFIYLIVVSSSILVFVLLLFLPFMSTLRDRLLQALGTVFGAEVKTDTSTIERVLWLDYGFYLGAKNILFGYGANGFAIYSGIGTYAHSNFSEILCDFGVVGLILFYFPLFALFFKAITNKRVDKPFVITFFLFYLIISFTSVFYYKKIYYLVLAFLFYLLYVDGLSVQKVNLINKLNKVLFTCDSMKSGGAERVIASLSNEMAKHDIRVSIIGVADTDEPKSFYRLNRGVRYLTLSNGKKSSRFCRIFKLRKLIKIENPDIVISFLPNANIYTWVSLINTGIPFIVSERNNPYINPKGKLTRFLKDISFNKSNGAVFQTEEAMKFYSDAIIKKGAIIKNPINLSVSKNICSGSPNNVVLAVGRLTEQKNYPCLMNAFKKFNEKFDNGYVLKIYGDGHLKDSLKAYCNELEIKKFVCFVGNDNNWHEKEINDALYVLSSDYEGFPNALAEAMTLGIPAVSTDCPTGGPRKLIKNGINGYLCPVNDSDSLYENMIKAISEPRQKYIENAKRMAVEYSIQKITCEWINYILSLKKEIYE